MKLNVFFLISVMFFTSCTFQKRLYRKGFYVEKSKITVSKTQKKNNEDKKIFLNHLINKQLSEITKKDTSSYHQVSFNNNQDKSQSNTIFNYSVKQKCKDLNRTKLQLYHHPVTNIKYKKTPASIIKPIDPVLKSQYISIIFHLFNLMLSINYYNFFYLNPFFWVSSIAGGFMLFFLIILNIILLITFINEKNRNYKAANYQYSNWVLALGMILYGFLLPAGIYWETEAYIFGLSALPYSVNFFWFNLIVSTLLFMFGIYLLYFTNKKDNLMKASEIVETDVKSDAVLLKKIQRLRKIKLWIYLLSIILILTALSLDIFYHSIYIH